MLEQLNLHCCCCFSVFGSPQSTRRAFHWKVRSRLVTYSLLTLNEKGRENVMQREQKLGTPEKHRHFHVFLQSKPNNLQRLDNSSNF